MAALKTIGKIVAWILLGIVLFNQAMGIFALAFGEELVGATPPAEIRKATWLVPLWLFTTLLIVLAIILCAVWKKKEHLSLIPMGLGIIGAVLALVIALTFYAPYDMVLNRDGELAQTDWDWFWRHLSLVFVSLITAVISFIRFKTLRDARIRKENNAYEDQFAPAEGDDPVAELAAEKRRNKKLSKKQRKALREKENSGK